MTDNKPTLVFPHPTLTPITGTPTYKSLQLFKKQLYANARAIHSTLGGGNDGHLALVMPNADYLARTGVAFVPPAHPGGLPIHAAGATGPQITEANRQYDHVLTMHTTYTTVQSELKKQILTAVNSRYLSVLEDNDFGFADVTPQAMIAHLLATYGIVTPDDIEANRLTLSAPWNVDEPVEELWLRIHQAQQSAPGAEPIIDAAAIRLTLTVLEKTGVFTTAIDKWRDTPEAQQTLDAFKTHFNRANKERIRQLTVQTAGYHGANTVTTTTTAPASANTAHALPDGTIRTNNGTTMYYCWSHGLGKNPAHTSMTCRNKKEGHKDAATADNLMGGNNTIMAGRPRRNTNTNTTTNPNNE